jgi:hypothetical protein
MGNTSCTYKFAKIDTPDPRSEGLFDSRRAWCLIIISIYFRHLLLLVLQTLLQQSELFEHDVAEQPAGPGVSGTAAGVGADVSGTAAGVGAGVSGAGPLEQTYAGESTLFWSNSGTPTTSMKLMAPLSSCFKT